VRDRMQHAFGSSLKQVGKPNVKLSLAQPDGVVDGNERIKTNVEWRRRSARAKLAKNLMKNLCDLCSHVEGRVARDRVAIIQLPVASERTVPIYFFLRFMYSSTSVSVLRWSSVLESTVSSASVSWNSYSLSSSTLVLAEFLSARSLD